MHISGVSMCRDEEMIARASNNTKRIAFLLKHSGVSWHNVEGASRIVIGSDGGWLVEEKTLVLYGRWSMGF